MPLQPEVQQLIDGLAAMGIRPMEEMTPSEVRTTFAALGEMGPGSAPDFPWWDGAVPGPGGDIPVRVYDPAGSSPQGPVLVWYHGGGWVIGDLVTADQTCRHLAALTGIRVVSVDYRLAPEHPFPAAADDAYAAYEAVRRGTLSPPAAQGGGGSGGGGSGGGGSGGGGSGPRPSVVAVGGDSAGGNLAAVVTLMARERAQPQPAFQLLVYPVTDAGMDTASYHDNAEGYFLTEASMRWFFDHYVGADAGLRADPRVSPLRAASLEGLAPAHVVTAEYDPLRDEGEAYATRLRDAGVAVTEVRYDGQIHGFFGLIDFCGPTARQALETAATHVRNAVVQR